MQICGVFFSKVTGTGLTFLFGEPSLGLARGFGQKVGSPIPATLWRETVVSFGKLRSPSFWFFFFGRGGGAGELLFKGSVAKALSNHRETVRAAN